MSPWMLYAAAAVAMTALGFIGTFEHRHAVRRILALNIASSGVFLILVATARRSTSGMPDPVPHALVLTGIVVSVSATAVALSLARRLARDAEQEPGPSRDEPEQ